MTRSSARPCSETSAQSCNAQPSRDAARLKAAVLATGRQRRRRAAWLIDTPAKQCRRQRQGRREEKLFERLWNGGDRRKRHPSAPKKTISAADHAKIAKILGMLGSAHEGERLAAAAMAEKERQRLGLSWEQLIG